MYIGKTPTVGNFQKCDALTASATADYTLQVSSTNVVPESVNHMIVSLNGVIQAPTTAYTVSGSTLSFASALTSNDSIDFVMLLGNVLDIGVCSDATVSNAKLGTDVISGETDIGGAIADADLFLLDDGAGGTLRKTAASRIKTYVGGGITVAGQWRLSAGQTSMDSGDFITDNWEQVDTNYSNIGSAMSESSGVFTFPETGVYLIEFVWTGYGGAQSQDYIGGNIYATVNDSSYSKVTACISGRGSDDDVFMTNHASYMFDVTSTSTHKIKFAVECENNGMQCLGNSSDNRTYATFIRLGDT